MLLLLIDILEGLNIYFFILSRLPADNFILLLDSLLITLEFMISFVQCCQLLEVVPSFSLTTPLSDFTLHPLIIT
jgi:hypothetical protein